MARIPPAVAEIRVAVRRSLTALNPAPGSLALVACSGGPDSLALAAAAAFVAPRLGLRAGLVSVDHGLQPGSAERAETVVGWGGSLGLAPAEAVTVDVAGRPGGPEAAAREARYGALAAAAVRHDAVAVLLGHTRDDQAETVLLALARGAGSHGLSGMPQRRPLPGGGAAELVRPLLDVSRAQTHEACATLTVQPWSDPHNADPSYARARVRAEALPALTAALGEGVVGNLARTAGLIAADTAALDALARDALAVAVASDGSLRLCALERLLPAVRTRVLQLWSLALGAPGAALSHRHIDSLDALLTRWRGQGPTFLPGGIEVSRQHDHLVAKGTTANVSADAPFEWRLDESGRPDDEP